MLPMRLLSVICVGVKEQVLIFRSELPLAPLGIRTFDTINSLHDIEHEPAYQVNAFTIVQFFSLLFLAKRVRSPLLLLSTLRLPRLRVLRLFGCILCIT